MVRARRLLEERRARRTVEGLQREQCQCCALRDRNGGTKGAVPTTAEPRGRNQQRGNKTKPNRN